MCLAVPMQITRLDGFSARCTARGVEREVSLFMLQDEGVVPGDFVLVHVGYAIQKISREDAEATWELFDQILAAGDADA
ncbi:MULTISPECIES: HypC/HybG/HupF family hydrogenase formation chaperone [Methylococcus]|jgi:hydrogenase expression/formation protein HypC|uniref:HypC/HybG/HupF family hydrogenase formation chaperone n=1 Tax=Methylococcus TaxID=413 RepID=UPI001C528581|nr:HypC/HybG/HupF family hydrogenase formation chaperone [Methylococcus capsulatus]QXP87727.1 HypC/HybG/HupF family hydrogenase formation chaperone [Methylococcus capsulatus]QXP92533.1 HypC/HybG/HupF family hydrogenase formation chaperone [Methylococcus capsulatus]UQN12740.1 HypC/HybG/HupF family hydrogenase formation chaperone [Methylococcus capsulatus]